MLIPLENQRSLSHMPSMAGKRAPLAERFWAKVDRRGPAECWPWLATKNNHGYGMLWAGKAKGYKTLAHRISYELHFGLVPEGDGHHGTVVMHTCDNPGCVNPGHLTLGTQGANMADKHAKGRARWGHNPNNRPPIMRGSAHGQAKLTEDKVRELRIQWASGVSLRQTARETGLDRKTLMRVKNGTGWRHVT